MTVAVIGEAGLGKTRLVQESAGRLDQDVTVLTGRCLPYGEGITFYPLRDLVRQAVGGDDSPERIKDLLGSAADAAGVAERLHRAFGPGDQGRSDAAEIFWAARRFLRPWPGGARCWSCWRTCTGPSRPLSTWWNPWPCSPGRHRSPWSASPAPSCWNCASLGRRDGPARIRRAHAARRGPAAELLDGLTAGQHISPSTRARVLDTATGNPLFSSSSRPPSASRPGARPGWRCHRRSRLCSRPDCSAWGREPAASWPGRRSSARSLANRKSGSCSRLRRAIRSAVTSPCLSGEAWSQHGPGRVPGEKFDFHNVGEIYSFRHILIQQAAYQTIPKSERAELHRRYADWLEYDVSEPIPNRAELLGYHLEQSVRYANELWPADARTTALAVRAADHLEAAGSAAHDRGDDLAAVNLLDRAAALRPDLRPGSQPDLHRSRCCPDGSRGAR